MRGLGSVYRKSQEMQSLGQMSLCPDTQHTVLEPFWFPSIVKAERYVLFTVWEEHKSQTKC